MLWEAYLRCFFIRHAILGLWYADPRAMPALGRRPSMGGEDDDHHSTLPRIGAQTLLLRLYV